MQLGKAEAGQAAQVMGTLSRMRVPCRAEASRKLPQEAPSGQETRSRHPDAAPVPACPCLSPLKGELYRRLGHGWGGVVISYLGVQVYGAVIPGGEPESPGKVGREKAQWP
jgi:hypothetical protein